MKRKYLFAPLLVLALTACTNDNDMTSAGGEVRACIVADIDNALTRASGESWAVDDRIGVSTVAGTSTDYSNVSYRYDGSGFEEESTSIYFQSDESVTFHAYYPYNEAGGILAAVTDAEAQKNLPAIDFLYASGAVADKTAPAVQFTGSASFHHCMSQITLTFEEGNGVDLTDGFTGYSLNGLVLEGEFNTESGVARSKSDQAAGELSIALENVTLTGNKYYASPLIVFPQSVSEGKLALEVNAAGNVYKAALTLPDADGDGSGDTSLNAGCNYKFPVRVTNKGLEIGTAEIFPWNEVEGEPTDAVM